MTFLSGSSLCTSAVQLGTKEAGICQHDTAAVKPAQAARVWWPTVHGAACGVRRAACGVRAAGHGVGAACSVLRAAGRACVRA